MYKVEKFICRCLDSIYNNKQHLSDIEILLIDDESPDNSVEVARKWIDEHNAVTNIRIINQQNRGLGGARNTGLNNALSPWIWFIDTDDEITDDSLSVIFKSLNTKLDFITFNFLYLPENSLGYTLDKNYEVINPDDLALFITLNSPCFNIFRTEFLRNNNLYFKEKFLHEDNEFAIRANFKARNIAYHPHVIYYYYTNNGGSITKTLAPQKVENLLAHFDTYYDLLRECPTEKQVRAMQSVNLVPFTWLTRCLQLGSTEERKKTRDFIVKNRWKLRKAFNLMPLIFRIKLWLKTSPIYLFLVTIRK